MLDPNTAADFVFDPDAPAVVNDPFSTYAWLREHAPVYRWDKGRAFLVSCHPTSPSSSGTAGSAPTHATGSMRRPCRTTAPSPSSSRSSRAA